ncbi:hypothetical protein [Puniceibacterium confluentis]|uniref:hypothetical protein n=1 Tax=Puniceibacterium confluentis TaxID=1958944 RepID=UPI003561E36D
MKRPFGLWLRALADGLCGADRVSLAHLTTKLALAETLLWTQAAMYEEVKRSEANFREYPQSPQRPLPAERCRMKQAFATLLIRWSDRLCQDFMDSRINAALVKAEPFVTEQAVAAAVRYARERGGL